MLLFDEPFGALDAQTRGHLRREIRALLKKVNVPAIFITHDQEEALELGDRIAVINVGHIEQIGTPAEVYNNPANEYVATFLGAANILEGIVAQRSYRNRRRGNSRRRSIREKFKDGQPVKLVFRPEDVSLSKTQALPSGMIVCPAELLRRRVLSAPMNVCAFGWIQPWAVPAKPANALLPDYRNSGEPDCEADHRRHDRNRKRWK